MTSLTGNLLWFLCLLLVANLVRAQVPGWQLLGINDPSVLVNATIVPTSKIRVEVFPLPESKFLSVEVFYSSVRLMGISPADIREKIGAGVRLYPAFYTLENFSPLQLLGEDSVAGNRYLTIMPFVGAEGRHHRRNSFVVSEREGLLLDESIYTISSEYGIVGSTGMRILYGGRRFALSIGASVEVGYMYTKTFTYEADYTATKANYQEGWQGYLNMGEFLLGIALALGRAE